MCSGHALLALFRGRREKAVYALISFNYFCHFTSHFESGFVFFLSEEEKKKPIEEVRYEEKWNVTNN